MKYFQLSSATLVLINSVAFAQVTATDPADLSGIPETFLPTAKVLNFVPHDTPAGYVPNPNPRDFTSAYVAKGPSGPPPAGPGFPPPGGGAPGAQDRGPPPPGAPGSPGGPGVAKCLPGFGIGAEAIHLVSSPHRLTFVAEDNHQIRRIYIGEQHTQHPQPAYSGESVGNWEGNTLVVDTIAIKGRDGTRLVERWKKLKNGSVEIKTTTFDAQGKAVGPVNTDTLIWRPDLTFVEDICEDFGEAFGPGYGK